MTHQPTADQPHFEMTSSADDPRRIRRPMSDLADVDRTMGEIIARQATATTRKKKPPVAAASKAKAIDWQKPVKAFDATVDRPEIERRLKRPM